MVLHGRIWWVYFWYDDPMLQIPESLKLPGSIELSLMMMMMIIINYHYFVVEGVRNRTWVFTHPW